MVAHEILKCVERGIAALPFIHQQCCSDVQRQGLQVTKCITDGFGLSVDLPPHK